VWRGASRPLIDRLHGDGSTARPVLTEQQRTALLEPFLDDINRLEQLTAEDFGVWRQHRTGDTFHTRRAAVSPTT
jgi:hypothetical protein